MKKKILAVSLFVLFTIGLFATFASSDDVPVITKEQLKAMLGKPDCVIFDVRMGSDYFSSDLKIEKAVRPDMGNHLSATLFAYPKGKTFVIYCASPNEERSTINVKDILNYGRDGYSKVYVLKGGWEEWFKAGYPTEKK